MKRRDNSRSPDDTVPNHLWRRHHRIDDANNALGETGAVFAEYAIVMVTTTLLAAFAVAALSVPLLNLYTYAETLIGLPLP